ncbi:MAG: nitroreductase family protein [Clostridiales bacterium]|nr:nitroreductase family protein [Clostridiales bacterium]
MIKEIYTRRSIRRYIDKKIPDECINEILKAGMNAPSARNLRPYEYIVVKDREMLTKLSQIRDCMHMLAYCDFAIISLARETMYFWQQDMGAATQNMLLQSHSMGIGSCWMGIYPEDEPYFRELFDIPEDLRVFNIISFGYTSDEKEANNYFDDNRIHYEKYTKRK